MKIIKINRILQDNNQTLGNCTVYDETNKPIFSALSLELGWRDNTPGVSCIPVGIFSCVLEWSNRFSMDLWEVKGVENRSEIKFHYFNHYHESRGCISLGSHTGDIDDDGYADVLNSRNTMDAFHEVLKDETEALVSIKNTFYDKLH